MKMERHYSIWVHGVSDLAKYHLSWKIIECQHCGKNRGGHKEITQRQAFAMQAAMKRFQQEGRAEVAPYGGGSSILVATVNPKR